MSDFVKYQHVERFGRPEVAGIEDGNCLVFPKLDGTNASVWVEDGEVHCGSRKRHLSLVNDNAGFCNWVVQGIAPQAQNLRHLVTTFPEIRFFGEWLVPHTFKGYRDDAWRRFYIFDAYNRQSGEIIPYDVYRDWCGVYNVDYIPCIAVVHFGREDQFWNLTETNDYLCKPGAGPGEGIVIKNYCPTPDQRVLTGDLRWVPAGDLEVGDELIGVEEDPSGPRRTRKYRDSIVMGCDREMAEVYEITLSDGTKLKVTGEHPWLITRKVSTFEWRKTSELRLGWKMQRILPVWNKQDLSYEAAWLAGFFDGEGTIVGSSHPFSQVSVVQLPGPVLERAKKYLSKCGFEFAETSRGRSNVKGLNILGGKRGSLRFLGVIRPLRLLNNFDANTAGSIKVTGKDNLEIVSVEPIGQQEIVVLGTSSHTYLLEGFVAHNSFKNQYGRTTWAKMVRSEFKEKNYKEFGCPVVKGAEKVEQNIATTAVTATLVQKERAKIESLGQDKPIQPRLLETVWRCVVCEELYDLLRKVKYATIDFKLLRRLCTAEIKRHAPDLF